MKIVEISKENQSDFKDYLKDESNISSSFEGQIIIPRSELELSEFLASVSTSNSPVYVSGKRTGLVGGAVPIVESEISNNTVLVSLESLNSISNFRETTNGAFIDVLAGTSLSDLITELDQNYPDYFFPVDPTERSASFGGMLSTNASGSRGFKYGSVRNWVESIRVVLVDGSILELNRGIDKLNNLGFKYQDKEYSFNEIYKPKTKNSIGYNYFPNMDLLDLFIGSEGTLGITTSITLRLLKKPKSVFFVLQLFEKVTDALSFIKKLRSEKQIDTLSIEYFDSKALEFASKSNALILSLFNDFLNNSRCAAVYFEVSSIDPDFEFEKINELVSSCNAKMDNSVFAETVKEQEDLKRFRHAVPEGINKEIAKRRLVHTRIRKVATDMAVENEFLGEVYDLYEKTFSNAGLEYVVFGHGGDNHFHVNILPRTNDEVDLAVSSYESLAESILKMNGSVAAEHGIGRLKKKLLKIQYPPEVIQQMIDIKKIFDPNFRLNIGVLF